MTNTQQKLPIIREQTLEHIAIHFGELAQGWKIANWLQNWGVPETLINRSGSKWWMVNEVFKHYAYSKDKKDHETLFKIIGEILHPIMYGGDKQTAEKIAEDFNKYLQYDKFVALYDDEDKKYSVWDQKKIFEVLGDDEISDILNQEVFEKEQEELAFLRLPENKEKISILRKAYQTFINITEVFCDNPLKPSHELNDAYVKTKKLITDAVRDLRIYEGVKRGARRIKLEHYCIPFNNLFTAEAEYKNHPLEKLQWDNIRPQMNATYGCIDELYRTVEGSDVLSKPDVQQTLNEVSLLLSKTKEENKKLTETRQETPAGTEYWITKDDKSGDYYFDRNKIHFPNPNADYVKIFIAVFSLIPQGGGVVYSKITAQCKETDKKAVQRALTGEDANFFRYVSNTNRTPQYGIPLFEATRNGKELKFNNKR